MLLLGLGLTLGLLGPPLAVPPPTAVLRPSSSVLLRHNILQTVIGDSTVFPGGGLEIRNGLATTDTLAYQLEGVDYEKTSGIPVVPVVLGLFGLGVVRQAWKAFEKQF